MVTTKTKLSEEIRELLNELLDSKLEKKLVLLIESGKGFEDILEDILAYLKQHEDIKENMRGKENDRI